ncbi:hypothetical protein LZ30DRAFT_708831 [Colletotrichum cereale]|nr:hypothetical protein LZ30DRAFT_708831 [Colletotrichum cereale]
MGIIHEQFSEASVEPHLHHAVIGRGHLGHTRPRLTVNQRFTLTCSIPPLALPRQRTQAGKISTRFLSTHDPIPKPRIFVAADPYASYYLRTYYVHYLCKATAQASKLSAPCHQCCYSTCSDSRSCLPRGMTWKAWKHSSLLAVGMRDAT